MNCRMVNIVDSAFPGQRMGMKRLYPLRLGHRAHIHLNSQLPTSLNRLGVDTNVYLGSAELAAVCALMGKIPTVQEYLSQVEVIGKKAGDTYRYMNFDQIPAFREIADTVTV